MLQGKQVPRSKCIIDNEIHYYDLMNSKEKTEQKDTLEYLGYGKIVSTQGVIKDSNSKFLTGHFWRNTKIPKEQNYTYQTI